ncbi:hypothetical protein GGE65_006696 [Skermanella aerolata]|uniref:Uncharacterized protein n=1 Tax=Skermanella aerolata TaxID=393310 RepID=A0A512DZB1_9PROT|nr:hypothetical protein [Skermanella aerolata]KJB93137.1 hypothetical protein N826_19005 [Skermanella aerolata KACC 11604]GEO41530.1 hypothetical protein SAE02_56780 [Skermanella aerolata]
MAIAELQRIKNACPPTDPLHRILSALLAALEKPRTEDRSLVDITYSFWYLGDDALCRHLLENLAGCPLSPAELSQIEILVATRHWIDGQIPRTHQLLQKQVRFLSSRPQAREISFIQSLGRHLVHLLNTFVPDRYRAAPGTGAGNSRRRIDFIGDSHVLAAANLIQPLGGETFQVRAHYVPGVKLWHVIQEPRPKYAVGMDNAVAALARSPNSFAVFSVGEIDCRPNAGFYNAIRRGEYEISAIPPLVDRYLERLEGWRRQGGSDRVGIWSIPAPREDVLDQAGADKALVRDIVATVSDALARGAAARGYVLFDLYALTQRDGFAVAGHHIDHAHVGSHVLGALAKDRLIRNL